MAQWLNSKLDRVMKYWRTFLIMMIKMMLIVFLIHFLIHIYRSFILAVMKELLLGKG